MQAFEWYLPDDGEYYTNMKERIPELKDSGFDAIWLPPMFKATGTNDTGYGIYDLYDLGEFDQKGAVRTKYGTLEELRELVDVLHEHDMQVFADVVLNQKKEQTKQNYLKLFKLMKMIVLRKFLMLMILKDGLNLHFLVEMENIQTLIGI